MLFRSEGAWTPPYSSTGASFSYSVQAGRYIKVGQLVYAQFYLLATASGTTSNSLSITGLPFTSVNSTYSQPGNAVWFSGTGTPVPLVQPNNTVMTPYLMGSVSVLLASAANSAYFVGMVVYQAAN